MEYQLHNEALFEHPNSKSLIRWAGKNWFQLILVFFALHVFFNKDVNIQVNFNDKLLETTESAVTAGKPVSLKSEVNPSVAEQSVFNAVSTALSISESKTEKKVNPNWKPSDFNNLSFALNPGYAEAKGVADKIVDEKLNNCRKYIERFAKLAISEMNKYQIPASITLAQGLLESNAGESSLAVQSNNHFGIKCRSKCKGCTCRNYSDDDVYDMFRVFDSAWESYREHSLLLSSSRYKHLKKLSRKDYKNWAHGLKKAGYATDKKYAEKLIQIIEVLDLYQFDK